MRRQPGRRNSHVDLEIVYTCNCQTGGPVSDQGRGREWLTGLEVLLLTLLSMEFHESEKR